MNFDITSLQNPRVKHIVRLREDKHQRHKDGLMLVEGWTELEYAISSGLQPQTIITAPELVQRALTSAAPEILTVSRSVFEKMSYRENPDGWLGIFPIPDRSLDDFEPGASALIIVAESVEKPGNLGAILRTADAAGADALLVCDHRVDLWSPNVVRASRGALFSVPAIMSDNASALSFLRRHQIRTLAATPSASRLYTQANLKQPVAVIVGTEDAGLTDFWLSNADENILIPMLGRVNSLNVSIATALIVFEALRQRNQPDHV